MKKKLQRVLYVWQARYPWDVRVEKICNALKRNGIEVEILARRAVGEQAVGEPVGGELPAGSREDRGGMGERTPAGEPGTRPPLHGKTGCAAGDKFAGGLNNGLIAPLFGSRACRSNIITK